MKKSLLLSICVLFSITAAIAQQKIKDGTVTGSSLPNKDALLELESNNKGFLQARVALVETTSPAPLSAHVAGMVVYNTATANDVVPGVYYNDGTKWISAKGANGIVKVEKQPGKTGTPGLPGAPGGPALGTNVVINDTGTYIFDPQTNTYTLINAKGDKGEAGVVGVEGLPGTSGTPGIPGSGTPGAPGAGVTIVTNDSGTYVYNPTTKTYTRIDGPKGDKGDAGVVGVQGLPGTSGVPGIPGSGTPGAPGAGITIVTNDSGTYVYNPTTKTYTRIDGPKGDKGDAGVVGVQGLPGTSGVPGIPGSGTPGAPGAGITIVTNDSGTYVYNPTTKTYTRIDGPKGDKGDAGAIGAAGPAGPVGATGAVGPQGIAGVAGPKGDPGTAGAKGDPGVNGTDGTNGTNGATGVQGPTGPIGATGPAGATGPQGPKGDTGTTGPKGDTGTFTATANNGVNLSTATNIQLGGALTEKTTTITAAADKTLAIAGLVVQTDADLDKVDGMVTVEADGTLRKVYQVYSTSAAQNTLKKWIDGKTVYERVGQVTLATGGNTVNLAGVVPANAKLLGIRFINQTTNSISTNILEYSSTTQDLVLGTGASVSVFHPAGSYDIIVEYVIK